MTISRYRKGVLRSGKFLYKIDQITKKKKKVLYFDSVKFRALSDDSFDELEVVEVAFKSSDTLMGLAQKHYGDAAYWWVIALINNVGSERDIALGQTLVILQPLDTLLPEFDI